MLWGTTLRDARFSCNETSLIIDATLDDPAEHLGLHIGEREWRRGGGEGASTLLVPAASILNGPEGLPREINPTTQPSRTFSDAGFQVNESPCHRTVRKSTVSHHTTLVPYNPPPRPPPSTVCSCGLPRAYQQTVPAWTSRCKQHTTLDSQQQ